jgi:hypothetical protein
LWRIGNYPLQISGLAPSEMCTVAVIQYPVIPLLYLTKST